MKKLFCVSFLFSSYASALDFNTDLYGSFGIRQEKWETDFGEDLKLTGTHFKTGIRSSLKTSFGIDPVLGLGFESFSLEDHSKHGGKPHVIHRDGFTFKYGSLQGSKVKDTLIFLEGGLRWHINQNLDLQLTGSRSKRIMFGEMSCNRQECKDNSARAIGFDYDGRTSVNLSLDYVSSCGFFTGLELGAFSGTWSSAASTKDPGKDILGFSAGLNLGYRWR